MKQNTVTLDELKFWLKSLRTLAIVSYHGQTGFKRNYKRETCFTGQAWEYSDLKMTSYKNAMGKDITVNIF